MEETIAQKGPFDGAFGFSQGASILVAYLIEQKMAYPSNTLPFQFVILCSPTLPLAANPEYNQHLFGALTSQDEARIRSCQDEKIAELPSETRTNITSLVSLLDAVEQITHKPRSYFLDRSLLEIPFVLHPNLCEVRITLPALHVRGKTELPAIQHCGSLHRVNYQLIKHSAMVPSHILGEWYLHAEVAEDRYVE